MSFLFENILKCIQIWLMYVGICLSQSLKGNKKYAWFCFTFISNSLCHQFSKWYRSVILLNTGRMLSGNYSVKCTFQNDCKTQWAGAAAISQMSTRRINSGKIWEKFLHVFDSKEFKALGQNCVQMKYKLKGSHTLAYLIEDFTQVSKRTFYGTTLSSILIRSTAPQSKKNGYLIQ